MDAIIIVVLSKSVITPPRGGGAELIGFIRYTER